MPPSRKLNGPSQSTTGLLPRTSLSGLVRTVKVLRSVASTACARQMRRCRFLPAARCKARRSRHWAISAAYDRSSRRSGQDARIAAACKGVQSRRVERAVLDRQVVVLRRIQIDLLVVAAELQLQTAAQILFDTALNDPFLGVVGRGRSVLTVRMSAGLVAHRTRHRHRFP
jgi:hypothetical protein